MTTASTTRSLGPLVAVLDAFASGASTLDDVAQRTGLTRELVDGAVDHLVRTGRIDAKELSMGCPSSGCGSCASATAEGTPGCGATAPSPTRRGPVLVTLSLRRPAG